MTDTDGKHTALIEPDADTIYTTLNYAGSGDQIPIMFGPECEFFICKFVEGEIRPIDNAEAEHFKALFREKSGAVLHQEAIASHFELNYGPMNLSNFAEKIQDYLGNVRALYRLADEQGYRVIPSSHAPHIEGADDVIDQLVDRERIQMLVPVARKYMGDNLVKFANLTAGIHISSAYRDPAQFYDDLRRTNYLSPFIYALSNNGFPFWQGMKDAKGVIPRMAVIEELAREPGGRTGIDPLFYEAADGEDFLRRYIERMVSIPILCFRKRSLDLTEIFSTAALKKILGLQKPEPGLRVIDELGATPENPLSFSDLKDRGLNTISNLQFAASSVWYTTKVQDLPINGNNGLPLKRFEDRVWNGGPWQIPAALLVRALMTEIPECGREVDEVLAKFGFMPEGPGMNKESAAYLKEATEAAWKYGGKVGLDFRFGKGSALEFGREFTSVLLKHARVYGVEEYLAPMEYITQTNKTDAVVLRQLCRTPEEVRDFLAQYDIEAVTTPGFCLGMLHEQGRLPAPEKEPANDGYASFTQQQRPGF